MNIRKLFTRHFLITAAIVLGFVFLGFLVGHLVESVTRPQVQSRSFVDPPVFFAKLLDRLAAGDRVRGLKELTDLNGERVPVQIVILDSSGQPTSPVKDSISLNWSEITKPVGDYEAVPIGSSRFTPFVPVVVRLPGSPAQYLYVAPRPIDFAGAGPPPGGPNGLPHPPMFVAAFGSLLISILLGVAFSLLVLFRALQKRVRLADSVIAELRAGNLKARFPIRKMDEIGEVMSRFNMMADEIERLVNQLRNTERARMKLLQELAHDLRTPVASLKNFMETGAKPSVPPDLRKEMQVLAVKEIDYFERLVEDLLVLAQVSEPRYRPESNRIEIAEVLEEEVEGIRSRVEGSERDLVIEINKPQAPVFVSGDEHLIRRMIKNALENAISFAKRSIRVSVVTSEGNLALVITDDGPGFPPHVLKTYGERRVSREIETGNGGRVSVGLGSVIIRTVARLHGGDVFVSNSPTSAEHSSGAEVRITLPASG